MLGVVRRPFAKATAASKDTNPIGTSQSRLNQRVAPILIRGAIPKAAGMAPAQVFGSTVSSPTVSFARNSRIVSGETRSDGDCDGLVALSSSVFSDIRDSFYAAGYRAR